MLYFLGLIFFWLLLESLRTPDDCLERAEKYCDEENN
jgi:hypothetical protein